MRHLFKAVGFLVEYLILKPLLYGVAVPILLSVILFAYSVPVLGTALAWDQMGYHARSKLYSKRETTGALFLAMAVQVPWSWFFLTHAIIPLGTHWGLWK